MQSEPAIRVRAPATTANIGPGFDCAGAALDLWNELELMPGDEPPDRDASRRAGLRAPRPRRRLELPLHRPDPPGTRARLERLGGGARAGRGGDRRQAGADGRRAARTRNRARRSRRQPRRGAHGRRLPDVGNAHRPDRGHRAGDADRGRSGASGRDRVIEGRASRHRPARRRCLLRGTRRAPRRRAGEQLGRPLRGSPGRSAARALPRRELAAPRPGSRTATRRRARCHLLRRRPDCHRLGPQRQDATRAPTSFANASRTSRFCHSRSRRQEPDRHDREHRTTVPPTRPSATARPSPTARTARRRARC